MTLKVTVDEWSPLPGAIPERVEPDKIYVIPTRAAEPIAGENDDGLRYTENVRYFPKAARSAHLPVEFSTPVTSRKYLSEFGVDPDMWSLGLACLTMANGWLILAVSVFIEHRSDAQGWAPEEANKLPLRVRVAETKSGRTYEVSGDGKEVLAALRELNESAIRQIANDVD